MKVRVIGDKTGLDPDIQTRIRELEEASKDNDGLNFTIAINYGSRDEIARAVRHISEDVAAGKLDPASVTEETISNYLDTAGIPDPDLLIRTSGELRLSNFLRCAGLHGGFILRIRPGRISQKRNWRRPLRNIIAETEDMAG